MWPQILVYICLNVHVCTTMYCKTYGCFMEKRIIVGLNVGLEIMVCHLMLVAYKS